MCEWICTGAWWGALWSVNDSKSAATSNLAPFIYSRDAGRPAWPRFLLLIAIAARAADGRFMRAKWKRLLSFERASISRYANPSSCVDALTHIPSARIRIYKHTREITYWEYRAWILISARAIDELMNHASCVHSDAFIRAWWKTVFLKTFFSGAAH